MQALFDAVDITGVSTSITTLMTGFLGITLLFFGYRIVKKLLSRGV